MKLCRDKGKQKHPTYAEEFSEEFSELESEAIKREIAGGAITKRISEMYEDASVLENFPF